MRLQDLAAARARTPPSSSTETGARIPFFDLLYQIDLVKSGEHHPDGMMWIRTP